MGAAQSMNLLMGKLPAVRVCVGRKIANPAANPVGSVLSRSIENQLKAQVQKLSVDAADHFYRLIRKVCHPNTLLHDCLLGCIVQPYDSRFLLLKGHRPRYFLCLLLSVVATCDLAAALCLCCCFVARQVLGPGVAPFLLLFSCIQHLPDRLTGSMPVEKQKDRDPVIESGPVNSRG